MLYGFPWVPHVTVRWPRPGPRPPRVIEDCPKLCSPAPFQREYPPVLRCGAPPVGQTGAYPEIEPRSPAIAQGFDTEGLSSHLNYKEPWSL